MSAETKSHERPIVFSDATVRAILAGRKTQVRVPVTARRSGDTWKFKPCPYGQPGDRLWVRETWAPGDELLEHYERDAPYHYFYRADGMLRSVRTRPGRPDVFRDRGTEHGWNLDKLRWRPSIHMPRDASRLTLDVVSVRAEFLKNISTADCVAEGIEIVDHAGKEYAPRPEDFMFSWDSAHARRGPRWSMNPTVWVIEFRKINKQKEGK